MKPMIILAESSEEQRAWGAEENLSASDGPDSVNKGERNQSPS
jgi:hypothetical protein